jgi:hypothetical protein
MLSPYPKRRSTVESSAIKNKLREFMITIVSGLPRSGTSLTMHMLAAGGMPILSDGERQADADHPRGYLEWERIKQLPQDPAGIAEGEDKAVKVISRLLLALPEGHEYRVIFMQRPLPEVLASREVMLRTRSTAKPGAGNAAIAAAFEKHLREVDTWMGSRTSRLYASPTHEVLRDAESVAKTVTQFLGAP